MKDETPSIHTETPAPAPTRQTTHSLWAVDRKEITVRGVTNVHSFDEGFVDLDTSAGRLTLEGRGLHVTVLDTKEGTVAVTGTLTGLLYDDGGYTAMKNGSADDPAARKGKGRLSRLFR